MTSGGAQTPGGGIYEGISGNGRFVVFETGTALVPGDTNGRTDVYVRDRRAKKTIRMSVSSSGRQGNADSGYAALSSNGRYVVFWSEASNLVRNDTNGKGDVFLRDRQTGKTSRVSITSAEKQATGGGGCGGAAVTSSGRFVLFYCELTNLVPGDTNGFGDLFVRDRLEGTTRRVTVSSAGQEGNNGVNYPTPTAISADGRFVVFASQASNLVPGDTNAQSDVFLHDRRRGTTTLVSRSSTGAKGNGYSAAPAMTPDARLIVFASNATNLVTGDGNGDADIFIRNREAKTTKRVSLTSTGGEAEGSSDYPGISADGRFVVFDSYANDLVNGDGNATADVFVRDRKTSQTRRVSVVFDDAQANGESRYAFISADGRFVAFQSDATNLVPGGDSNGTTDIYVRGPLR